MIGSRRALVEELVQGLRTPLSRVELAATQLARSSATPAAASLARGISDAVSQLDQAISEVLDVLGHSDASTWAQEDCSGLLASLRTRMEPVLRARSVEWADAEQVVSPQLLGGRAEAAGAALMMLHAGTDLAGPGGRMWLRLVKDPGDRLGVELCTQRSSELPALDRSEAERVLTGARSFTCHRSGRLEIREGARGPSATLWLGGAEEHACDA